MEEAESEEKPPAKAPTPKKKSRLQQLREGYEGLVSAVVRPPRSKYNPTTDLGPKQLTLDSGTAMQRDDFTLINYQNLKLECSLWKPIPRSEKSGVVSSAAFTEGLDDTFESKTQMAVVYLHGNSSCRVDATRTGVLETVGPLGAALVAFDFAGSGLSDGEYVTLGWVSLPRAAQIWVFWPAILATCLI